MVSASVSFQENILLSEGGTTRINPGYQGKSGSELIKVELRQKYTCLNCMFEGCLVCPATSRASVAYILFFLSAVA